LDDHFCFVAEQGRDRIPGRDGRANVAHQSRFVPNHGVGMRLARLDQRGAMSLDLRMTDDPIQGHVGPDENPIVAPEFDMA